jgi:TonB-linked SusC/RagA family outer membrane protein
MGGSSNILIRGSSSLVGNNQALFVVDGVPMNNYNANNAGQRTGRSGFDYGNPASDINPTDIANISVLKGAAATALYGSRAANGVVIITTKKGSQSSSNKVDVNVNHSTMIHTVDKSTFPEHQTQYGAGYGPYYSGTDYPGLYYYDLDGDGTDDYVIPSTEDASMGSKFDPDLMVFQYDAFFPESPTYLQKSPYVAGANGADYFMETGHTIKNSVDVSGGTSVSTFRLAYSNSLHKGMYPNSEQNKNSLSFNASYDIFKDLKISANAMYTNTYTKGRNHTGYSDNIMSMFRQWYNVGVDMKQQEELYELTKQNISWNPNSEENLSPIYWDNPYWQRYQNYQSDERNRLLGYLQADWNISENLSFMGRYSVDNYSFVTEERKAIGSVSGEFGVERPDVQSGYDRTDIFFTETNFDGMLRFNRDFSSDFNLNAFVGTNIRRTLLDQVRQSTNGGLAVPDVYAIANSADPTFPAEEDYERIGVNGYFGSLTLGFLSSIFLEGTYRYDISSTLPSENRGYGYYSASGSFVFSEMVDASWMNLGKLRLSVAQVGNDAPWGRVNSFYEIVSPFGGRTQTRYTTFLTNPGLRPEISTSLEAGLEMYMVNNRVHADLSVYKTNTIDQITPLAVSRAYGYRSRYVNIGEIENKGVEILLGFAPVATSSFRWDIDFNWAKNVNEVISLSDKDQDIEIEVLQIASLQGGVTINAREGQPYGTIQGTDFQYSPDGQKLVSATTGHYLRTGTSDKVLGDIQPDWIGGITNTLRYKNLTASFLIDMQVGGNIFSLDQWYGQATGLYPNTVENNDLGNPLRDPIVGTPGNYDATSGGVLNEGVIAILDGDGEVVGYEENTRRVAGDRYTAFGYATSPNARYIYEATYFKLRELSISYSLPKSIVSNTFIKGATISLIGSNLWIISKDLPHADPEASQSAGNIQGWQSGVAPTARSMGFSINLTF